MSGLRARVSAEAAMVAPAPRALDTRVDVREGMRYGALGAPLAFVALPLYIILPSHYAGEFGVPLAVLGAVLLGVRLFDALVDPWIGRAADAIFARTGRAAWLVIAATSVWLAIGFHALFFPALRDGAGVVIWCAVLLVMTTLAYSVISVLHQAWGARLGGDEAQRAGIVAWREGYALAGVFAASLLPSLAGLGVTSAVFASLLAATVALLAWAPRPAAATSRAANHDVWAPLRVAAFRRLLAIFVVNGVASAMPATLVLFFIRDRLQAPHLEPLFLALYFAAAACALPLWVRLVARLGLAGSWLAGMLLAVATFAGAATLGAGDAAAFALVCAASGVALGADLALPSALLAGLIRNSSHAGSAEGAYFGWWNFAAKLTLALAAGLALPALQGFGYAPGARDAPALAALTLAYCVLPCMLKLAAALLLWASWIRVERR